MSMLSIKATPTAGTNIDRAICEGIRTAKRLGVTIEINFNGCILYLDGTDSIAAKLQEYDQWLKTPTTTC